MPAPGEEEPGTAPGAAAARPCLAQRRARGEHGGVVSSFTGDEHLLISNGSHRGLQSGFYGQRCYLLSRRRGGRNSWWLHADAANAARQLRHVPRQRSRTAGVRAAAQLSGLPRASREHPGPQAPCSHSPTSAFGSPAAALLCGWPGVRLVNKCHRLCRRVSGLVLHGSAPLGSWEQANASPREAPCWVREWPCPIQWLRVL